MSETRAEMYARLRDKYSHPARGRGTCGTCTRRFGPDDRIALFGGYLHHAGCLDDFAYMRLASITDIVPGIFDDMPTLTLRSRFEELKATHGIGA